VFEKVRECRAVPRADEIEMALEAAAYAGAGARPEGVMTHPVRDLVVKAERVVTREGALIG